MLDDGDQSTRVMDFGVLAKGAMAEKYVAIYNAGTVPMSVLIEVDSPLFSVGTAGNLQKLASTGTKSPSSGENVHSELAKDFRDSLAREIGYMAKQMGLGRIRYEKDEEAMDDTDMEEEDEDEEDTVANFSRRTHSTPQWKNPHSCVVVDIPPSHWQPVHVRLPIRRSGTVTSTLYILKQSDTEKNIPTKVRTSGRDSVGDSSLNSTSKTAAMTSRWARSQSIINPLQGGNQSESNEIFATGSCVAFGVRAHSGTISLRNETNLKFGEVGTGHRYMRKIKIVNTGSLPLSGKLYWKIRRIPENWGYTMEDLRDGKGVVELVPNTTSKTYGPRFRWKKALSRLRFLFESYR